MTNTVGTAAIEMSVETSRVESGLNQMDNAVERSGRTLASLGATGTAAMDGLGAGAAGASTRVDAATRNMISQIQRTMATMEAGSRTSRQFYESLAAQRGVDVNVLRPYLEQLDAVAARQRAANAALESGNPALARVGVSAAQTAAALRQVPAQFTDIITSLQGGQAPLTVFLQQGGQLRDMFGGTGAAARAMGGYVMGLITPLNLAAAGALALAVAWHQGSQEAVAFNREIALTGNVAGVTADQLADMARSISGIKGTQGEAAEALAALVATGQVGAESMQRFGLVAVEVQRSIGTSVADTAKDFEDLGKNPVAAIERLNDKYHFLTGAVYEQIKALEDQGRREDAAALAQTAYADAMEQRSKKVVTNLGLLERGWKGVTDFAKGAWDAMLGVGREDTLQQKLEKVQKEIAKARQPFDAGLGGNAEARASLKANLEKEASLKRQIELQNQQAAADAERQRKNDADIAWAKEKEKYLGQTLERDREITKIRNEGLAAGATEAEIAKLVGEVRKKYAETYNKGIVTSIEQIKRRSEIEEITAKRSMDLLNSNRAAGLINERDYIKEVDKQQAEAYVKSKQRLEDELRLAGRKVNAEKEVAELRHKLLVAEEEESSRKQRVQNTLTELEVKETRQAAENYANLIDRQTTARDQLLQQVQQQKDYNAQIGLTAVEIADLNAARLSDLAAQREQQAAAAEGIDLGGEMSRIYREQAKALRDMASAKREAAVKEVVAKGAKDAEDAWRRSSENIENSITDALMRGFENGKSFGKNFWDSMVNMAKTTVLRPTVQAISAPVANGINSALGISQNAGAASNGFGSVANLVGMGSTITNAFNSSVVGQFFSGLSGSASAASAALGGAELTTAASFGASISSAIAAIPGWGWAAMGVAAAAKVFGLFDDGPEQNTRLTFNSNNAPGNISINERGNEGKFNQSYIDGFGTGAFGTFGVSTTFWSDAFDKTAQSFIQSVTQVDNMLSTFLTEAERSAVTAAVTNRPITAHTGPQGTDQNATGELDKVFAARLGIILDGVAPGLGKLIEGFKGTSQELAAESAALLQYRAALRGSGEAVFGVKVTLEEIAGMKNAGESAAAALNRITKEFVATNQVAAAFGKTATEAFGAAGLASSVSREELILAAGGIDALAQKATSFAQNYLTEAERLTPVTKAVADAMAALGLSSVDTRDEFKATLQGLDLTTEGGRKLAAAMLDLQADFALVHPAIQGVGTALRTAADIELERAQLVKELAEVGLTDEQKRRAAIDASNVGIYDQIRAKEKELAAREKEAAANADLQQQIDALLKARMSESELRAFETATMTAGTRALYERLAGLRAEDAQAAAAAEMREAAYAASQTAYQQMLQERARAEEDAAREAEQLIQQRSTLELELYGLTHSAAETLTEQRRREIEAMNAALRPLRLLIDAQKDLQSAAAAAGKAADAALGVLNKSIGAAKDKARSELTAQQAIIEAQKSAAQASYASQRSIAESMVQEINEQLTKLRSLDGALQSALGSMRLSANADADRASARQQIANALTIARTTGMLPDADALAEALRTVATQDTSLYSSYQDFVRDVGVTAGQIADLGEMTGDQIDRQDLALSVAQQELKAMENGAAAASAFYEAQAKAAQEAFDKQVAGLDEQATQAQAQLEAVNGTTVAVKDVSIALREYQAAVQSLANANAALAAKPAPPTVQSVAGTVATAAQTTDYFLNLLRKTPDYNAAYEAAGYYDSSLTAWRSAGGAMQSQAAQVQNFADAMTKVMAPVVTAVEQTAVATGQFATQFDNVSAGGNILLTETES